MNGHTMPCRTPGVLLRRGGRMWWCSRCGAVWVLEREWIDMTGHVKTWRKTELTLRPSSIWGGNTA